MRKLFHIAHLSKLAGLAIAGFLTASAAQAAESHFYGRWTVSDDKPAFSTKGKIYKTFDVAPCGADFCGVSVADDNNCGETLFRFLTIHAGNDEITGHGRWGSLKKKLTVGHMNAAADPESLYLGLGEDDMDLTGREGSIPTFQANYKRVGEASCTVK